MSKKSAVDDAGGKQKTEDIKSGGKSADDANTEKSTGPDTASEAGAECENAENTNSANGAENAGKSGDAANTDGDSVKTSGESPMTPEESLAAERDKYLRLAAEYENYRKRSAKERETMYSDARADTIVRLLPVYDNLERALKTECTDEAFYKGVEMTMTQLAEILDGLNVKQIQAVGEQFDPQRHDAVMSVTDPELGEKTVTVECKKGFTIGDRVIRHASVVVAN